MIFGDYRIETISDSEFRLDGGAMFGVVPRVIWEKVCPPDEFNRIRLQTHCLFIETPTEKILVETGIGEKWTEKQTRIYGIFREKSFAETLFEKTGCRPSDISIVVNTHLHFDHCGGNTIYNASGEAIPQFPNARYFVSKSEFNHAENPNERDKASYISENWKPLEKTGQLELKPDNYEAVMGLTMRQMRGHNANMQTACLRRGGETLFCFADLVPTRHHLPLAWVMGFDLYPTETLANKKRLLPLAVEGNWLCLFYHDHEQPLYRLIQKEGKFSAQEFSLD
jgi:glyoxylase-like metal-dependent hydrolase (beta-lactamase superfamily II)